jgi:hypothetical protein
MREWRWMDLRETRLDSVDWIQGSGGGGILTAKNISIQNGLLCMELTNATEQLIVAYFC